MGFVEDFVSIEGIWREFFCIDPRKGKEAGFFVLILVKLEQGEKLSRHVFISRRPVVSTQAPKGNSCLLI